MDISVTIITSIAVALIYVFIIKPKKDKKAAEMKENQTEGGANVFSIMQVSMVLDTPDPSNISYSE